MTKRTKLSEFKHFNKLANEWWSESGKYKILHKIRPIRIKYIKDNLINDLPKMIQWYKKNHRIYKNFKF